MQQNQLMLLTTCYILILVLETTICLGKDSKHKKSKAHKDSKRKQASGWSNPCNFKGHGKDTNLRLSFQYLSSADEKIQEAFEKLYDDHFENSPCNRIQVSVKIVIQPF